MARPAIRPGTVGLRLPSLNITVFDLEFTARAGSAGAVKRHAFAERDVLGLRLNHHLAIPLRKRIGIIPPEVR
jgi:hypothetical protein